MTNDTLRDRQATPDQADSWELLTENALSRDEQAFLRALADENDADGLRLEAYAPLDADFRERMTDRLGAQLAEGARTRAQMRRRRTIGIGISTAALAAAASLLFMFQPRVQVPEYALTIEGQVATERGVETASNSGRESQPMLTPSSMIDIRLTPATRVESELTLSAFLERDGKVWRWSVPVQHTSTGAFRIRGTARELLQNQYGELHAIFVIAPKAVTEPPTSAGHDASFDLAVMRARLSYLPIAEGAP